MMIIILQGYGMESSKKGEISGIHFYRLTGRVGVEQVLYHHQHGDGDDDGDADADDDGYPAHSHHDKIPPCHGGTMVGKCQKW